MSVITEKGDVTTSYLLIQRANTPDSGKYTCNPSNANLKTVVVHVLNGKLCNLLYFLRKRGIMVPICLCAPLYVCVIPKHLSTKLQSVMKLRPVANPNESVHSPPYFVTSYHCEYQKNSFANF